MTSLLGIPLALACALAANIAFLFKHRGAGSAPAVDMGRPLRSARELFASRWFTIGMGIGALAWIFHVAALSVAPLSLVQSVLAGGMVLLAVMAERIFGIRIGRRQWIGLGLTALGLMLLAVTLPVEHGAHSGFSVPGVVSFEAGLIAAGTLRIMSALGFGAAAQRSVMRMDVSRRPRYHDHLFPSIRAFRVRIDAIHGSDSRASGLASITRNA